MVGYSRLMQIDEAGILARQKAIQAEVINPTVSEFGGRIVKTTGDGALIEFASATDAVLCSAAIQRTVASREADTDPNTRIAYRFGINLGDIIDDEGDIFGDGVNVAARLEGLAEANGICISQAVFNNVKGKTDLGFADIGPQSVKNLADPIHTYRVLLASEDSGKVIEARTEKAAISRRFALAGMVIAIVVVASGYLAWTLLSPRASSESRVLVLPFRAENTASQNWARAATENLISSFSRVSALDTASHSISMTYDGFDLALKDVPEKLGVRYLLDGTARLDGEQVVYSARLRDTNASGEGIIWEQTVEGDQTHFLALLADLKKRATAAMKLTLNPSERAHLEAQSTEHLQAYLDFAEAERFRFSGNFFELGETLPLYESAMEQDPTFIDAYVGYAYVNYEIWRMAYNTLRYTPDALAAAEQTVATIVEHDKNNPFALGIPVGIKIERNQWDLAVSEARGAVFLQPDEPWLRFMLGQALLAAGEYDEAREQFDNYLRLSPKLNSWENRRLAFQRLLLGDAEEALALLTNIPNEQSDRIDQYYYLANAYAQLGQVEKANANMEKFLQETQWNNLLWQEGYFGRYSDPEIFENWAKAMSAAGMPASPFDFEKGRENDRLLHNELIQLYSERYEEKHTLGPFGMPYSEERRLEGTMTMHFAWLDGQPLSSTWAIKGDQLCHRTAAVFAGREQCNNIYIDRTRSNDDVKYISNVYSFGVFDSVFSKVK